MVLRADISTLTASIPDLPEEVVSRLGGDTFARSPGSDVWVSFYDLPEATAEALWAKSNDWHEGQISVGSFD